MAERIIQLASNLSDLSPKRKAFAFLDGGYASEKMDGVLVFAMYSIDNGVQFFSSSGDEIVALKGGALEQAIKDAHIRSWTEFVLIGEAYHPDLEQAEIGGMCRKELAGHAVDLELHVHDVLSLEAYRTGKSDMPYESRLRFLQSLLSEAKDKLVLLPQREIKSAEELSAYALEVQQRAGEGVCYRPRNALWEAGDRSTNLIRIKEKMTYDLEALGVSGVEAGAKGGLKGVLQVKWRLYGKPDGEVIIQDIRGMKHDQLRSWSENPELIVGQIVEVEAMKFTAYGMLREPRFKGIREDKAVADL